MKNEVMAEGLVWWCDEVESGVAVDTDQPLQ